MERCSQPGISDAAFAHLRGTHTLRIGCCTQAGITDAALAHLRGIHTLDTSCAQAGITGAGLAHLRGVRVLYMDHYTPGLRAAAEALGLPSEGIGVRAVNKAL